MLSVEKQLREAGKRSLVWPLTEFLSASLARHSDLSGNLRHDMERDKNMRRLADHFYLDEVRRMVP